MAILIATFLASCATQSPSQDEEVRQGAHLFRQSCATCHGASATGNGPVAPLLTVKVPDLTRIAQRRGGQYPELEVFRIIDGQSQLAAHGPRHMPIWGYEFFGPGADDEAAHGRATLKIDRLVSYLRSTQQPR
jgi:mono/diheme cytochrome c family protein